MSPNFGEPVSRMLNKVASPIASGPQEEIPPMPENFAEGGEAQYG